MSCYFAQISAAAHKVDHLFGRRIVKHSVYGEIAPLRILFGRGKMHCARMSSIDVGVVGPKGGDFELETIFDHHGDTEMRADRVGARKNFLDGLGRCIGGDIEIFGGQLYASTNTGTSPLAGGTWTVTLSGSISSASWTAQVTMTDVNFQQQNCPTSQQKIIS